MTGEGVGWRVVVGDQPWSLWGAGGVDAPVARQTVRGFVLGRGWGVGVLLARQNEAGRGAGAIRPLAIGLVGSGPWALGCGSVRSEAVTGHL